MQCNEKQVNKQRNKEQTRKHASAFCVCLTASLFVGAVGAVGVVVAHPGQRNALAGAAAAGELLRRALLDICEWHFCGSRMVG